MRLVEMSASDWSVSAKLGERSPSTRGCRSPCLVLRKDLSQCSILSSGALMRDKTESNSLDNVAAPGILYEALGSTKIVKASSWEQSLPLSYSFQ